MKMKKLTEDITSTIASMMDQIKISKSLTDKKDSPKDQYPTTVVLTNKRDPPLEGGHYTKIGSFWNFKHEIISPKFYENLINTVIKAETDLKLKKFYSHINMCLNASTRLQEALIPSYQYIKRNSDFEEYFVPDSDHPSYYLYAQTYTSL